jgi:hypothetical protein
MFDSHAMLMWVNCKVVIEEHMHDVVLYSLLLLVQGRKPGNVQHDSYLASDFDKQLLATTAAIGLTGTACQLPCM